MKFVHVIGKKNDSLSAAVKVVSAVLFLTLLFLGCVATFAIPKRNFPRMRINIWHLFRHFQFPPSGIRPLCQALKIMLRIIFPSAPAGLACRQDCSS